MDQSDHGEIDTDIDSDTNSNDSIGSDNDSDNLDSFVNSNDAVHESLKQYGYPTTVKTTEEKWKFIDDKRKEAEKMIRVYRKAQKDAKESIPIWERMRTTFARDADELAKNTFSSTRKDVASITSTFPLEIREIIWKAAYVEDKPIKFGRASAPLSLAFIDRTRYLGHKIVSKSTSQEVAKIFYRDNIFKLPIIDDLRSFGVRDQFDSAVTPSTLVERLILKFQYSESRGPPPDNAKYMAMFECQTGAGIDWFEAGTRMEHHLEPLHDFVALKEITIRIRRGRYTTWDPRGFVNPIMHLKERGINVKVLLCQDIVSINERIIAGQDVSSCFDFPSEEEKVQLQHLLRCSHKDDPRPGSHVPIQVFTNEQRRRGQGTFRFPCFGGCDRTFTNRGCPNDWDPWKFGFYRALVHEYRNLYLEYVFKNDVECEFCGEEAEEGVDLFKKGKEPHSLRVVLDDRRNELDYDDEEFPLHAAHCRCLRECRYPEGEPEDMEWEGNESEDSIWS